MAYTDVWDVTTPLDTQPANQGAVDFRATKLDIMQRVASFGAGLLANRPTPETTGPTADWTGVMYWTTDTKQVFRWSGAAWVDISTLIAGRRTFATFGGKTVAPLNTILNNVYLVTLPGGTLSATGGFEVLFTVNLSITSGQNMQFYLAFDSTRFPIRAVPIGIGGLYIMRFRLINTTPTTNGLSSDFYGNTSDGAVVDAAGIDTTVSHNVGVQIQKSNGPDTADFHDCVMTIL